MSVVVYTGGAPVTVTDTAPVTPPAVVDSFTATPANVTVGAAVLLAWSTRNASGVTIDNGVGTQPANGSISVTPASSATFRLIATGTGGNASASVSVNVAPPVPSGLGKLTLKAIADASKVVCAPGYFSGGSAYDRFQLAQEATGPTSLIARTLGNQAFGSAMPATLLAIPGGDYPSGSWITIDNQTTPAGANSFAFNLTQAKFDSLSEGYYWLSVNIAGWVSADYPIYIRKGATATDQAAMPVCIASYSLQHLVNVPPIPMIYQSAMVPAVYAPTLQPLPARTRAAFATPPARDMLNQERLTIYRPEDEYRIAVTEDGRKTSTNRQPYFFSDFSEDVPKWELLDGPRGHGCLICPTSLRPSRRATPSGKVYFTDSWRFGVIGEDGTIATLWGYRHAGLPDYWNGPQHLTFVGQYDASVPAEYRVTGNEFWGLAWWAKTLDLDPNAPPIGGEQPHTVGPQAFLSATKSKCVWRITFPKDQRTAGTGSLFATDLLAPWACEEVSDVVYVTDRDANALRAYDATNGAPLWSIPINGPTGLCALDGFLYVGSKPDKAIWKVNIATHAVVKWRDLTPFIDNNSLFVNLAINDSGFSLRGTVGMVSWSNNNQGYPVLFSPTGSELMSWQWAGSTRLGLPWCGSGDQRALGYPSSVGMGQNSMVWGTDQECVLRVSKAQPGDPVTPANFYAGQRKYILAGYPLTNGPDGFGLYGLALPWNVDVDIDAYLKTFGHTQP